MIFPLNSALIGPASERPDPNDPKIPRNGSTPPIYICIDTLDVFQDIGTGWLLMGTIGSSLSGLASDGQGGVTVTGGVAAAGGLFTVSGDGTLNLPSPILPYPPAPVLSAVAVQGGNPTLAAGTYDYLQVYRTASNRYASQWSNGTSITVDGTTAVQIEVPAMPEGVVATVVYRSTRNDAGGLHYAVRELAPNGPPQVDDSADANIVTLRTPPVNDSTKASVNIGSATLTGTVEVDLAKEATGGNGGMFVINSDRVSPHERDQTIAGAGDIDSAWLWQFNGHGGLALFGKNTVPTAPRTLTQAAVDAIADAGTRAVVQVLVNAAADLGNVTVT